MKTVLITGSSGLIGSAVVEKFVKEKWDVIGVDNYARGKIFGKEAETRGTIQKISEQLGNVEILEADIRDTDKMTEVIKRADAIVHCAAQPSHPRSLEIPIEDFQINAFGTLNLLEIMRKQNPEIPFAFLSTNKVYGDYPNYFNYQTVGRRYENVAVDSFDETLPIDRCGHTPFGVSKVAADLYCQEYGINFGMKTATFRGGCLIGANQKAVEMHGFLGFFTKQILLGNKLKLYGGGCRVRDNIHSSDVSDVLYRWVKKPKPDAFGKFGKPYNLGGMRQNSVSIFETIDAIETKTGLKAKYEEAPERESDHIWWISDMSKFKRDYPDWPGLAKDLDYIFNELLENWIELHNLDIKLKERDYFKKLGQKGS
ncbi:NAD-dependent epimerase/dehydratase family protein [Candidatus Woesearchaeota archaeon]|nr:NAD-dependent epimerase/dehydratase family protein [Candidatus Woesearchaeota archaeon]